MSDGTQISWTDATWPVVTGCTHISEGCDNCYAAKLTSGRLKHLPAYAGLAENGRFNGKVRLLPERLDWPLRWRKPRKVFVSDMADLFHQDVPDEFIARVWAVMAACPQHTFQVLTKRHARMRSLLNSEAHGERVSAELARLWGVARVAPLRGPLPNVWAGVSVENQRWADIRIPALLSTPAAVRFLSCEPLLGHLNLGSALIAGRDFPPPDSITWVIAGGESGPNHRPMEMAWLERIASDCRYFGMPLWVKQDSGRRAGQQGRIPDCLWVKEFPHTREAVPA